MHWRNGDAADRIVSRIDGVSPNSRVGKDTAMRRTATFVLAAAVLAGLVASEAFARDGHDDSSRFHGAQITQVRHPRHSAHYGHHYQYDRHRHGYHGRHGYSRYHYYRHPYHHRYYGPTFVHPPVPGCRPPHRVYRYDYHPFNSFYYHGKRFGIGITF
jgi:hypothetical protein